MILQERDYQIFREINRWRFCLSRHIKELCGFTTERACNRRLQILREAGYIERQAILYGIPRLYTLTHKSRVLTGANKNKTSIRVDTIAHDIAVIDTFIHFMSISKSKDLIFTLDTLTTEREMQSKDGFISRRHYPDFVICGKDGTSYCIEVELSLKNRARLRKNIQQNFIEYDYQTWIVPKSDTAIRKVLNDSETEYPNIEIIDLERVKELC